MQFIIKYWVVKLNTNTKKKSCVLVKPVFDLYLVSRSFNVHARGVVPKVGVGWHRNLKMDCRFSFSYYKRIKPVVINCKMELE